MKPSFSALDAALHHARKNLLLANQIEDQHRRDGHDQARHHGGIIVGILGAEHADHHGQGALVLGLEEQGGQQVIVPYAD